MNISEEKYINIKGKNIVIIGLGQSGSAAGKLASYLGANVLISESNSNSNIISLSKKIEAYGINTELGGHSEKIFNADLWIISPGIPQEASIIKEASKKNIEIVSEIEFASWFTSSQIIAITGSNGKTTTVNLLFEMCNTNELSPVLGGNIGIAFSGLVLNDLQNKISKRVYILEISSFQMDRIKHFKPSISIFLNISEDHLDRYANMDDYINAKLNMMQNQDQNDHIIFNLDDQILNNKFLNTLPEKYGFSIYKNDKTLLSLSSDSTKIYDDAFNKLIDLKNIALPGKHNLSNILAAATAAKILGVPNSKISQTIFSFKGVAHRIEKVIKINGVTYYNDSKATNVEAVKVALDSFENTIHLILGGKDKGGEFSILIPLIKDKVKEIIAYGDAANLIKTALGDAAKLKIVFSLKDAVKSCHNHAQPGDIVLLSPGCASFDQFKNFEERGEFFKTIVNEMAKA